jgi:TorA maturation chaperone TorD
MHDNGLPEMPVRGVDDLDRARAQEYALLATLLSRSPDDRMLGCLALLRGDASPLGAAHAALAEAAAKADAKSVQAEYFDLFDGLGGSGFLPYASYYLTGSLYGLPLARLRQALQHLGIERAEHLSEPEDHAAILCELMASLAGGQITAPVEAEREIFETHLAPWIGHFFADLERTESASFYARVGALGRIFVEIETKAFTLPASGQVR